MEYLQGIYRISHVGTGSMCDFTIECPQLAQRSKAGQFVHIRLPGFTLRRPISICEVEGDSLRILFDVRGEGTRAMAQLREGDSIDVMGPLGNGFTLLDPQKKAVVVGGGIGVPPMLQTAKHYAGNATAILGFRDAGKIVLTQDFEKYGVRVMLATDDGSAGHHGLVTDLLRQRLDRLCLRTEGDAQVCCADVCAVRRALRGIAGGADGLRCGRVPGMCNADPPRGRLGDLSARLQGRSGV